MELANNALTTIKNINVPAEDNDIKRYINTASMVIERHCNTKFARNEYEIKKKSSGEKYMSVNYWNIDSESVEIEYNDTEITDFTVKKNQGMIYKKDNWPDLNDYDLGIKLTAGFILPKDYNGEDKDKLPDDIESACILLAQKLHESETEGTDIQRKTRGGISTTYFDRNGMPKTIKWLLSKWRFVPV